jgi:hypothetical protein
MEVGHTVLGPVFDAGIEMRSAPHGAAGRARLHLVDSEDGIRLVRAGRTIAHADEAAGAIGAPQMRRAVNLTVDRATRLVMLADVAAAAHTACHFIRSDDLVRATLALPRAIHAEAAQAARRVGARRLRMPHTNDPAAMSATREAGRAGGMAAVGTFALVLRAVRLETRRTGSRVLRAARRAIHAARRDPVIDTER